MAEDLMMLELSNGMLTCFNRKFYDKIKEYSWSCCSSDYTDYAHALRLPNGKRHNTMFHRLIMELHLGRKLTKDEQIDHIDGCGLNNALSNLQVVDQCVNMLNRGIQKNNTTGFRGVFYRKSCIPPYESRLSWRGKQIGGYCFFTKEAAAIAFDDKIKSVITEEGCQYDPNRVLNFPNISEEERLKILQTEQEAVQEHKKINQTVAHYSNVRFDKSTGRWQARTCMIDGKPRQSIGIYDDPQKAAVAADYWVIQNGLDDKKRLNFTYSDKMKADIRSGKTQKPPDETCKKISKYKYVSFRKRNSRWIAVPLGKEIGSYETEEEAARAVDYYLICKNAEPANFSYSDAEIANIKAGKLKIQSLKKKNASSQYRGVKRTRAGNWSADVTIRGERRYLGTFSSEIAAAQAVDSCIIENSVNKPLNFPPAP